MARTVSIAYVALAEAASSELASATAELCYNQWLWYTEKDEAQKYTETHRNTQKHTETKANTNPQQGVEET